MNLDSKSCRKLTKYAHKVARVSGVVRKTRPTQSGSARGPKTLSILETAEGSTVLGPSREKAKDALYQLRRRRLAGQERQLSQSA